MTAHVLWWNRDRGHGFIRTERGEDIFVHHTAIISTHGTHTWRGEVNLIIGQEVEFDRVPGTVGTVAANVRVSHG